MNASGVAYSNVLDLSIDTYLPVVETLDPSSIDAEKCSALLQANIKSKGTPAYTEIGFVYSTANQNPTIYDNLIKVETESNGKYEALLQNLSYYTEYYVRAYAKNISGVTYGDKVIVCINTELPVVTTLEATDMDLEYDVVVLHGEINSVGVPAYYEKGFVYSDVYENPTVYDSKFIVEGTSKGLFEYRSTELQLGKPYYIRAYAKNEKGVAYGEVRKIAEKDWVELPTINIAVQKTDAGRANWTDANNLCKNSIHEGLETTDIG